MKTYVTDGAMPLWEFQRILETQIIPQEKEALRWDVNVYRLKQEKTY